MADLLYKNKVEDRRGKSEKEELKRDIYNDIDSCKNLFTGLGIRESELLNRNDLHRRIKMSDGLFSEKSVYTLGYAILSRLLDIEKKVKAM